MKNWTALLDPPEGTQITCLYGGTASGKTYNAIAWCIGMALMAAEAHRAFRACVCRRTYPELTAACWDVAIGILDANGITEAGAVTIRDSPPKRIIFAKNVEIEFKHADRPSEIKGMEYDVWVLDEVTDISRDFYKETLIRIPRGDSNRFLPEPQHILTWNPTSMGSWVYDEFFCRPQPPTTQIVKSTYQDNPHVLPRVIAQLEEWRQHDPRRWTVYGLGDWGAPDELIYPRWRIAHDDEMPAMGRRYDAIGIDFGTANPTAVIGVFIDSDRIIADEILYRSNLTSADLTAWVADRPEFANVPVYCDPSGKGWIVELQRAGVTAYPAENEVAPGISWVQGRELLLTPRSVNLKHEIAGYSWQKTNEGIATDKPVKILDHACDALRYAAYTWHRRGYDVPAVTYGGFLG